MQLVNNEDGQGMIEAVVVAGVLVTTIFLILTILYTTTNEMVAETQFVRVMKQGKPDQSINMLSQDWVANREESESEIRVKLKQSEKTLTKNMKIWEGLEREFIFIK